MGREDRLKDSDKEQRGAQDMGKGPATVAVTIKALRETTRRRVHPARLSFVHGRNSDLRAFERFFGCSVEFAATRDQFSFPHETLALPLVTEDRYLLETLQPICDEAAKERHTPIGTLRALVENEVQKLLPHGKAKRPNVAKTLGLSERTLTRSLNPATAEAPKPVTAGPSPILSAVTSMLPVGELAPSNNRLARNSKTPPAWRA
jgi:hypothetical protein